MSPSRLFWGLIISGIGILILLSNLGYLPNTFWQDVWRLWPIILVLWGISILFSGKRSLGIWLSAIIIFIIVIGISFFGFIYNHNHTSFETTKISQDIKGDVKSGELDVSIGAVSLEMDSSIDKFVSGTADTASGVNISDSIEEGVQKVKIHQLPGNIFFWGKNAKNTLDIRITNLLPLDIKINAGASKMDLDFSDIKVQNLEINSGATSAEIKLGDNIEKIKVSISCGASDFNIKIPEDYSLKVTNKSGLSGNNLSELGLSRNGEVWQSSDYDTNNKVIEITFESGASNLDIGKY